MGYSYYVLPDGREAGYSVAAECDQPGCVARIDRGLGYLCGANPMGHKGDDKPGCGLYFCANHTYTHDCAVPECGMWDKQENETCALVKGHEGAHQNVDGDTFEAGRFFTLIEGKITSNG